MLSVAAGFAASATLFKEHPQEARYLGPSVVLLGSCQAVDDANMQLPYQDTT